MENKKYYYMKLKDNFFESESMVLLESVPNGFMYSNILLKMYLKSLKSNGRLMFNEIIPYNEEMIAGVTRQPVGVVKEALKYFRQLDLIEILDNGTIYMNDIELFIGQSSTEGERKKLARMKLKEDGLIGGQMSDKCPTILSLNSNSLISNNIENNIKENNNINVIKKEKDCDKSQQHDDFIKEIVNYLNEKSNKTFRPKNKETIKFIKARLNEGFTIDNFKKVIDIMCNKWLNTPQEMYLRPQTLFGTKFESYLNTNPNTNNYNKKPQKTTYELPEFE